jgi:hypothetical protein
MGKKPEESALLSSEMSRNDCVTWTRPGMVKEQTTRYAKLGRVHKFMKKQ